MEKAKILLTAFRDTSAEVLLRDVEEYPVLLLPNDKIEDSRLLCEAIAKEKYDFVISLGQKSNIKNKVCIETTARSSNVQMRSSFGCDSLAKLCKENGVTAVLSYNAGTSFCNRIYYNGLRFIRENRVKTKMVFLHIPFSKNIDDPEGFRKALLNVFSYIKNGC